MRLYRIPKQGSIDNLVVAETDIPKPGRGQALVKMHAASLNYRDIMTIMGVGPRSSLFLADLVPLSDGAGEVVETGEGVSLVKKGDRVSGVFHQSWSGGDITPFDFQHVLGGSLHGVLTEYQVFDQRGLVKIPAHLSYEEGSTLACAGVTAWTAVQTSGGMLAGQTMLVQGTGGVAIFALQFAHGAGARTIVTSSSDDKLKRARALGADETINYVTTPNWDDEVKKLTDGQGADHVIEVGGADTLPKTLRAVKLNGLVSTIGSLSGSQNAILPPELLRRAKIHPTFVGSRQAFEAMNHAIGHLKIKPVIDKVFPFKDAVAAYRYLESRAHFGKIVIKID